MRAARIDANQVEIVKALRALGVSVQHLHAVGSGCPDLLCAVNGVNFLIEVKDGEKTPSKQSLTPDQVKWHEEWKAAVHIVNSIDVAIALANYYRRKEQS
jgi:Holliday junction resolvase